MEKELKRVVQTVNSLLYFIGSRQGFKAKSGFVYLEKIGDRHLIGFYPLTLLNDRDVHLAIPPLP